MQARVASLPGSHTAPNEDAVLVDGDTVVLLDGATARTDTGCVHGTQWYAQQLAAAIINHDDLLPVEALASGITTVAGAHRATCDLRHPATPSAAVAIVQQEEGWLNWLVLGDTTLVVQRAGQQPLVVTDDRVERTAVVERATAAGLPIGSHDKAHALLTMKHRELELRNQPGGYWVAAADPAVAQHALVGQLPAQQVQAVALLTDGAARAVTFGLLDWPGVLQVLAVDGPQALLERVRAAELGDPAAHRWPRNKASDDATVVYIETGDPT
jgi:hypothetical protein